MSIRKLKIAAIASFIVAMLVLLGGGFFAAERMAPYPGIVWAREVIHARI
jgi:hypothetical protein